jgi:hypothetical protein
MHTGCAAGRAGASETSEVEAQLFDGCHQLAVMLSVGALDRDDLFEQGIRLILSSLPGRRAG